MRRSTTTTMIGMIKSSSLIVLFSRHSRPLYIYLDIFDEDSSSSGLECNRAQSHMCWTLSSDIHLLLYPHIYLSFTSVFIKSTIVFDVEIIHFSHFLLIPFERFYWLKIVNVNIFVSFIELNQSIISVAHLTCYSVFKQSVKWHYIQNSWIFIS